jgi:hypothetical protein
MMMLREKGIACFYELHPQGSCSFSRSHRTGTVTMLVNWKHPFRISAEAPISMPAVHRGFLRVFRWMPRSFVKIRCGLLRLHTLTVITHNCPLISLGGKLTVQLIYSICTLSSNQPESALKCRAYVHEVGNLRSSLLINFMIISLMASFCSITIFGIDLFTFNKVFLFSSHFSFLLIKSYPESLFSHSHCIHKHVSFITGCFPPGVEFIWYFSNFGLLK